MAEDTFQVIVVGGGPAGLAAAISAARAGAEVLLLERGSSSGAKNVMGGIFYTPPLQRLLPDMVDQGAPLERPVARRSFNLLSGESSAEFSFHCPSFAAPPGNASYTVLRAPFDRWLASRAEEEGVELLTGVLVEGLLRDQRGRVTGVRTRVEEGEDPAEGELGAEVVILAEGANALIAEREGFRPKTLAGEMAVAVKEVIALPADTIRERFRLEGEEGEGREYYGEAVAGMFGSGFIYTNRESVSLGVAVSVAHLSDSGLTPNQLLERFKAHPAVRPFWRGGETLEYAAHMIPEGGYNRLARLFADGVMVAGDAAGMVNVSPYHEGVNLAVASGIAAGETAAEAVASGECSAAALSAYRERLEESFVLKDMRKFAGLPGFLKENPELFSRWPGVLLEALQTLFTMGEEPKQEREEAALALVSREIGLLTLARTVLQGVQACGSLHLEAAAPYASMAGQLVKGYVNREKVDQLLDYVRRNW